MAEEEIGTRPRGTADTNLDILESMETSYITLLRIPPGSVLRITLQDALLFHLDFIALRRGWSLEETQNRFEALAQGFPLLVSDRFCPEG